MPELRVTLLVDGGPFPEIRRRVLRLDADGIHVQRFDPPGELAFSWDGELASQKLRHEMRLSPESLRAARRRYEEHGS